MSTNDVTGARLVSRVNDKNYEDGYDRIFRNKPSCLDAAYERKAMQDGMNSSPVFEENKAFKESEAKILEPLINRMLDFCVKYEEAENVSKEIRNLIKDNEKMEND